jgi:hypothetical protein
VRETLAQRILWVTALSVTALLLFAPLASAQNLNCEDFDSQAEAQQRLQEDPSDPDGLDGPPGESFTGIEGVACEDLPPPTNFVPATPPAISSADFPQVREAPKGRPQKGTSQKGLLRESTRSCWRQAEICPRPRGLIQARWAATVDDSPCGGSPGDDIEHRCLRVRPLQAAQYPTAPVVAASVLLWTVRVGLKAAHSFYCWRRLCGR